MNSTTDNPVMESTALMLARVRAGDTAALEQVVQRFLPRLQRFTRGRLPAYARELCDTDDLVQNTLIKAMNKIDDFNSVNEGAFMLYLRQTVLNDIRMEIRRISRQSTRTRLESTTELTDPEASVLQQVIGDESLASYERGLQRLSEAARQAVILRVEFDYSYPEIALAMDMNSANAARMLVVRSLQQLTQHMP